MPEAASRIACLGGPKEAALYFDHVFPIDLCTPSVLSHARPAESSPPFDEILALHVPALDNALFDPVVESLLGGRGEAFRQYVRQSLMSGALLFTEMAVAARGHEQWDGLDSHAIQMAESVGSAFNRSVRSALHRNDVSKKLIHALNREIQTALVKAGYGDCPTWKSPDSFTLFGSPLLPSLEEDAYFASIAGLSLIDVKNLSWQEVIELRKDPDAKAALRDLRLFFEADLSGKETSYIKDTLASRIYHHDQAIKNWGFDTLNRTLGVLFSKENALPAIASISTAFLGAPLAAAATGAIAFAVGSCAVELGRATVERKKMHLENPVRYLTDLKSKMRIQ